MCNPISKFKAHFGIESDQVKKTCIVTPFLTKHLLEFLNIKKLHKTKLFASVSNDSFTLIHTGIGAQKVGDAVLFLKDTPCQNILLFGACGVITNSLENTLGQIICPTSVVAIESFSEILTGNIKPAQPSQPHPNLLKTLKKIPESQNIQFLQGCSFGSLALEEQYLNFFKNHNFQFIDQEAAACFSAAAHIKKRALALFFISDILPHVPYYLALNDKQQKSINQTIQKISTILLKLVSELK
ncbi:MAG: hypothetical protein H6755_05615 [Candidatus Omnitrophica bacterium]|nr:hypothetical protein [Candidatus Omnitrophota bacterium]